MYYSDNFSGEIDVTSALENPLTTQPLNKQIYLGYDVKNGKVSAAYLCFQKEGTEYCFKGGNYVENFNDNVSVAQEAFSNTCTVSSDNFDCSAVGFFADTDVDDEGKIRFQYNSEYQCVVKDSIGYCEYK